LTNQTRQARQHICKIAACLTLNINCHDQEQEIFLPYPAVEVLHGSSNVRTKRDLVRRHSKFSAYGIGHFLRNQAERRRKGMADANTADNYIYRVRQLLGELGDPPTPLAPPLTAPLAPPLVEPDVPPASPAPSDPAEVPLMALYTS